MKAKEEVEPGKRGRIWVIPWFSKQGSSAEKEAWAADLLLRSPGQGVRHILLILIVIVHIERGRREGLDHYLLIWDMMTGAQNQAHWIDTMIEIDHSHKENQEYTSEEARHQECKFG